MKQLWELPPDSCIPVLRVNWQDELCFWRFRRKSTSRSNIDSDWSAGDSPNF